MGLKPVVTKVALDPEQAVLQTCAVSKLGVAWLEKNNYCFYGTAPGTGEACNKSLRGVWGDGNVSG